MEDSSTSRAPLLQQVKRIKEKRNSIQSSGDTFPPSAALKTACGARKKEVGQGRAGQGEGRLRQTGQIWDKGLSWHSNANWGV